MGNPKYIKSLFHRYKKMFGGQERDENQMSECRKEVFKRDKYRCQMPGCKRQANEAHHIIRYADSPDLRYQVDNMISLCKKHHKEVTGNETNYIKLFSTILAEKDKNVDSN